MTITIDLPEDAAATLNERAQVEGKPPAEFAADVLTERLRSGYEEEFPLDAEAAEKIRRGFADMDAGRTVSLKESQARIEALLTARQGNGSA